MVLESLLLPIPVISDQITPAQSHTSFPIKKTLFFSIYLQPKRNSPEIQPTSYVHAVHCTVISL